MTDLINLLTDLSTGKIAKNDLNEAFDEIAIALLRQTKIVTSKDEFYLREIEIYYYHKYIHADPYAHKNKRQLEFGEWYFHRYTKIESFLKSRRNGVDITFGNSQRGIYGGILIRKIQNTNTSQMIAGINKVARVLIDNIEKENVNDIANGSGQLAFHKNQFLYIDIEANNLQTPVYKAQRNGLKFKDEEVANDFYKAVYCYYNHNLNTSQIVEIRLADISAIIGVNA